MIKAIEVVAPNEKVQGYHHNTRVFLAGTIDMGNSENWQKKFIEANSDLDVTYYNPRRPDWDSSWVQKISNPQFNQQVTWELDNIDAADIVVFNFEPNSASPITLMELGYCLGRRAHNQFIIVRCPEEFHRKGNVDIICDRFNIPVWETMETLHREFRRNYRFYFEQK